MPKIAEIELHAEPERDEVHPQGAADLRRLRVLREREQANGDELAEALFDIPHVTNVFYVDHWITVTQDGGADWHELAAQARRADPRGAGGRGAVAELTPRSAAGACRRSTTRCSRRGAQARHDQRDARRAECVPYLQGDGGDLYVVDLEGNVLKVHYQGACGSCPSSTLGTLAGIEGLVQSVAPELQVIPV